MAFDQLDNIALRFRVDAPLLLDLILDYIAITDSLPCVDEALLRELLICF